MMLYREGFSDGATMRDIFLRLPGDTVGRPFLVTEGDEHSPEISPDGAWVAYVSDEFGDAQVFLRPLEEDGGRLLVSAGPAVSPVWAPDGSRLYYWSMADPLVEATIGFDGGAPRVRPPASSW